jgi:hypothetical protein
MRLLVSEFIIVELTHADNLILTLTYLQEFQIKQYRLFALDFDSAETYPKQNQGKLPQLFSTVSCVIFEYRAVFLVYFQNFFKPVCTFQLKQTY